jgi:hypothetical protein
LHTCRYPGCDSFFFRRDCAQTHMSYCSHARAAITAPEMLRGLEETIISEVTERSTATQHAADPVTFFAGTTYYYENEGDLSGHSQAHSDHRLSLPTSQKERGSASQSGTTRTADPPKGGGKRQRTEPQWTYASPASQINQRDSSWDNYSRITNASSASSGSSWTSYNWRPQSWDQR